LSAKPNGYTKILLLLARYLALALESQLGAIAVIRTALNFFLLREIEEERKITETKKGMDDRAENALS
jgi:uncharacterized membrane protein